MLQVLPLYSTVTGFTGTTLYTSVVNVADMPQLDSLWLTQHFLHVTWNFSFKKWNKLWIITIKYSLHTVNYSLITMIHIYDATFYMKDAVKHIQSYIFQHTFNTYFTEHTLNMLKTLQWLILYAYLIKSHLLAFTWWKIWFITHCQECNHHIKLCVCRNRIWFMTWLLGLHVFVKAQTILHNLSVCVWRAHTHVYVFLASHASSEPRTLKVVYQLIIYVTMLMYMY